MSDVDREALFAALGLDDLPTGDLVVRSPVDGNELARIAATSPDEARDAVIRAAEAFGPWRRVPPPRRGELVRRFGDVLRAHKEPLATLVTLECGKILEEARGEVQEAIDICDFAVGLSRQLYGLTIASERPGHRMMETWHPLGPVAVITAFNFPVAVWAWNAAIAFVCGDPVVWKPSEKTPLTALACQRLFARACAEAEDVPEHLSQVCVGGADVGLVLVDDAAVPLVSATGSTRSPIRGIACCRALTGTTAADVLFDDAVVTEDDVEEVETDDTAGTGLLVAVFVSNCDTFSLSSSMFLASWRIK